MPCSSAFISQFSLLHVPGSQCSLRWMSSPCLPQLCGPLPLQRPPVHRDRVLRGRRPGAAAAVSEVAAAGGADPGAAHPDLDGASVHAWQGHPPQASNHISVV
eukprot:360804-Chlamydomonas_euryale.AAC.1